VEAKINLEQMGLHSVISAAILAALDQQSRELLIKGALEHLLTPGAGYSGKQASPLEDAFKHALNRLAFQLAEETLANDAAVKDKIQGLLSEAMETVFVTNREKTVTKIAESITEAMNCHRDRY